MIREMIDDGEPIEEVRVNINIFKENNYGFNYNFVKYLL